MAAASRSVKAHTAGPRAHRMSPRPAQIHRIPGPLCVLLGPRMWIVRLALRRPYTFVVVALLIVVLGMVSMWRMPTDIFPDVDIPVASVVWSFTGISPEDMERRVLLVSERAFTGSVNDIERIESQAMVGVGLTRIYFQPGAKIEAAIAQLGSTSQSILRALPPGMSAPLIIRYSASTVPILQLSVASETLPEAVLFDYAQNFVRTQLATVRGASVSLPYGGKPRQIMVDLDPRALKATGLAPSDVVNAISAQNLILPTGTAKIGAREYSVRVNSSPDSVEGLNNLPIKQINGAVVYIRDVAQVRDGYSVQTNIASQGGRRASLVTIFKSGGASTLDVVQRIKDMVPKVQATLPPELDLKLMFDQSIFVRAAVDGVVREAVIAAGLTALTILIFLGSWRSTLIVTVSIPLSILSSVIVLGFLGHTINIMTLGGLALAVGILVDDATVEIENIHRNLAMGKPIIRAILDGAQQIAVPAFVSTLCICIVFVPVVFLEGAVRFLFTPLALAVALAMMASYFLSRTLVPTMVHFLLASEVDRYREGEHGTGPGLFWAIHGAFNRRFERLREWYRHALAWALGHRATVLVTFALFFVLSLGLAFFTGEDFFPVVDAGQLRLHVRAPAGTRIEETDRLVGQVAEAIRRVIPEHEISRIVHNLGIPIGSSNLAYTEGATIGPADGEMLISLTPEHRGSTFDYMKAIRKEVYPQFPEMTFFFQSADIVSQTLNFGLQSPIDLQVVGNNRAANFEIARRLVDRLRAEPGLVDVRLHQVVAAPQLRVEVDRTRAAQLGMTQRDVANNLLVSLASSSDAAPNFWLNPQNGVSYRVSVQTPQYRIDSLDALSSEPMVASGVPVPELLTSLAQVERGTTLSVANHYNIQNVFDVYASVQDRDLGGAARDVRRIMASVEKELPRGTTLALRGQVQNMDSAFRGLASGLVFAVILVYCLMVVNFQSWLDPFIIITALPGALSGILLALFVTQTTINVPSLMGAIMSIGVATANSILLVTFANDQRKDHGLDATAAALSAGHIRLRPVLMTALAMIIGMLPMALGLGEGAEQNAPLGRAVIGGLAVATVATLFVVPVIYSLLRRRPPFSAGELHPELAEPGAAPREAH
jgi:multidrug efflux pump subunit AcrB